MRQWKAWLCVGLLLVPPAPCFAQLTELQAVMADKDVPLSLKPNQMDAQWRKMTPGNNGGPLEALMIQQMMGHGRTEPVNSTIYTKGQIVRLHDQSFLVAYRPQTPPTKTAWERQEAAENAANDQLAADAVLTLSLLNLRDIGNLNDIQAFDPKRDIAKPVDQEDRINRESMSNLKQIGLGLAQYVQDYDEKLPPMDSAQSMSEITRYRNGAPPGRGKVQQVLWPYLRNTKVFAHPKTRELYRPNLRLSGRNLASFDAPEDTLLFYEATPASDKKRAVLFLDGHVERVADDRWMQLKKQLEIPKKS